MATLTDLNAKRVELNNAIDTYKQTVSDFNDSLATQQDVDNAKAAAIAKGDEYSKLALQVKQDNPGLTDDQFYSNPTLMSESVRNTMAEIVQYGSRRGLLMAIDTEATTPGNKYVVMSTGGGSNYEIDWGDGTVETIGGGANHTYATAGVYTVSIKGYVATFGNPSAGQEAVITEIKKWGGLEAGSWANFLKDRVGVAITATDQPTFAPGANVSSFFNGAQFTGDISHWDMSNVVNVSSMFANDADFTSDITTWDMSGVTNFGAIFSNNDLFNQNLSGWDTSAGVNMDLMFYNASTFSQDLSGWNVANVNSHANFSGGSSILQAGQLPAFPS